MSRFLYIFAALVGVFIALPTLVVVPLAFNGAPTVHFPPQQFGVTHFGALFSNPTWMRALANSFGIGIATAVLTTLLVVPAAYAIERYRIRGHSFVMMVVLMPLLVPHIVTAVGYFRFFGQLSIIGSHLAVVLAHTCIAIPPSLLVMVAVLRGYPANLDRAAAMCGASPLRSFVLVAFPILRPGIFVSGVLAFIQSFDEAVIVLFIAGRNATTLPKRIFESLKTELDPVISVVSTVLIFFAAMMFALVMLRRHRQGGQLPF